MRRPAQSTARSLAASAVAAAWLLLVVGSGGCEVAVSGTVPAFACEPGADTCPMNQVCNPKTNQCDPLCTPNSCGSGTCSQSGLCITIDSGMPAEVSVNDSGTADTSMPDTAPPPDTGVVDTGSPDTAGPCPGAVGCPCAGASACTSGICADALTVTTPLYNAAGMTNFCTEPCCTSTDCPAGNVCFATGQGGNYCVNPTWVARTEGTGSAVGGASCSTGRDCASGLCVGDKCVDTCCSSAQASECSGGETCQFAAFPGLNSVDKNYSAYCATPPGTRQAGDNCIGNSDCESNFCADVGGGGETCIGACRSTSDCGAGESCGFVLPPDQTVTPMPVVAACIPGQGTLAEGAACNPVSDNCQGFCDPNTNLCTDVCFATTDCTKTGWTCRPETVAVNGGGSYSVLCCGS
jgi:hypothetical protein